MRETLAMVLIQPEFLYRLEPAGEQKRAITLDRDGHTVVLLLVEHNAG